MKKPIKVEIAGHGKDLFVEPSGTAECGPIRDGVVFNFEGEGGWVVSLATLEKICKLARRNLEKSGQEGKADE